MMLLAVLPEFPAGLVLRLSICRVAAGAGLACGRRRWRGVTRGRLLMRRQGRWRSLVIGCGRRECSFEVADACIR